MSVRNVGCATVAMILVIASYTSSNRVSAQQGDTKKKNPIDGAEMVYIPAGTFEMGSDDGEADEKPVQTQRVEGFWMYAKEVTNGQFRKFVQARPEWAPRKPGTDLVDMYYLSHWTANNEHASAADEFPVVFVSWHAARAYAEWASGRLPTEVEWEYAAKGGRGLKHGTSTGQLDMKLANYGRSDRSTSRVGSFPPNPFGLYDMAGNVWEWCSSSYESYPYKADDGREDLSTRGKRLLRGGSWYGDECRSSYRTGEYTVICRMYDGFRVVVSGKSS